jgi:hypothetical protein
MCRTVGCSFRIQFSFSISTDAPGELEASGKLEAAGEDGLFLSDASGGEVIEKGTVSEMWHGLATREG